MRYTIAVSLLFGLGIAAAQSYSPGDEALRRFNIYKPTIERTEQVHIESPKILTGDLNGDRQTDALVFVVKYPVTGGKAVLGEDAAVYLATGKGMKVAGVAPSDDLSLLDALRHPRWRSIRRRVCVCCAMLY